MDASAGNHLIFQFRKSRLLELEIETLKEQNYMLTEKLSHLINMTIGSFHILDGALGRDLGALLALESIRPKITSARIK